MIGNAVNGALIALSAAILCRYCRDTLHLVRQANCVDSLRQQVFLG
jgi:hypothetical protein